MKRINYASLILLAMCPVCMSAQNVQKVTANAINEYGITYCLPKTVCNVHIETIKTQVKAGPYALYAEKYLGIKDVPQEDGVKWEIKSVQLLQSSESDSERTFHIKMSDKGAMPTFYLADNNCLWSINMEPKFQKEENTEKSGELKKSTLPAINVLSEELLKAGSKAKQAEIAARQIFRIRESRLNLLTGDVDNLPSDGASFQLVLDNLEAQEKAYMSLFVGSTVESIVVKDIPVLLTETIEKQVIARFSNYFGLVDSEDLSGDPLYLTGKVIEDNRSQDVPEDPKKKKAKVNEGIAYCLPGKAHFKVELKNEVVASEEMQLGQLGHLEYLPTNQFDNKKAPSKAMFNPLTGAINIYE